MSLKFHQFSTDKLQEQLKSAQLKESVCWTMLDDIDAEVEHELVIASERDEMVAFLQEVCERDDMQFSVDTFALAVGLLDKCLASFKVKSKYLECVAVACLYIACKVREEDERISVTAEFLQDCDCRCSIAELLRMERMILKKFDWCIDDSNAADFLYLYHGLLINKWQHREQQDQMMIAEPMRWSAPFESGVSKQTSVNEVRKFYAPVCLDFLHMLEHQLKQCLCTSELTSAYRPHMLAFVLLQAYCDRIDPLNELGVRELCQQVRRIHVKESDRELSECQHQVLYHLSMLEKTNSLLDRFLREHSLFDRSRSRAYRTSQAVQPMQRPGLYSQLSVITEEEEEEEECVPSQLRIIAEEEAYPQQPIVLSKMGFQATYANVLRVSNTSRKGDLQVVEHEC